MSRSKHSEAPAEVLEPEDDRAGFTIMEALVSIAVVAICLGAIGMLMAQNTHAVGMITQHMQLVETMRKIETALPDRATLVTGSLDGEMADDTWSLDVRPFPVQSILFSRPTPSDAPAPSGTDAPSGATAPSGSAGQSDPDADDQSPPPWVPQIIVATVQSPSGSSIRLETVRLAAARTAQ